MKKNLPACESINEMACVVTVWLGFFFVHMLKSMESHEESMKLVQADNTSVRVRRCKPLGMALLMKTGALKDSIYIIESLLNHIRFSTQIFAKQT